MHSNPNVHALSAVARYRFCICLATSYKKDNIEEMILRLDWIDTIAINDSSPYPNTIKSKSWNRPISSSLAVPLAFVSPSNCRTDCTKASCKQTDALQIPDKKPSRLFKFTYMIVRNSRCHREFIQCVEIIYATITHIKIEILKCHREYKRVWEICLIR